MSLIEDHIGIMKYKQMMIVIEEKYILVSLIKPFKSLTIGLMRLIRSCLFVCRL